MDDGGDAYVTGVTQGRFPTTPGAFQTTWGGGYFDTFVTKMNATGTALVYSTYLGSSANDSGRGIAVDRNGHAYVTGATTNGPPPDDSGAPFRPLRWRFP